MKAVYVTNNIYTSKITIINKLKKLMRIQFMFGLINVLFLIFILINKDQYIYSGIGPLASKYTKEYTIAYNT